MPSIRLATFEDAERLTSLRVVFLKEIGDISSEQQGEVFRAATSAYFSEALLQGKVKAWVVEEEGQIVATSGLILFEQAPTPFNLKGIEGYVFNVYTLPAWRGQGLARRLMEEIIAYTRTLGVPYLWLYATDQGMPVYKKVGFALLHDAMGLKVFGESQEPH